MRPSRKLEAPLFNTRVVAVAAVTGAPRWKVLKAQTVLAPWLDQHQFHDADGESTERQDLYIPLWPLVAVPWDPTGQSFYQ